MKNSNIIILVIGGVVVLGSLYFLNKSNIKKTRETASNDADNSNYIAYRPELLPEYS